MKYKTDYFKIPLAKSSRVSELEANLEILSGESRNDYRYGIILKAILKSYYSYQTSYGAETGISLNWRKIRRNYNYLTDDDQKFIEHILPEFNSTLVYVTYNKHLIDAGGRLNYYTKDLFTEELQDLLDEFLKENAEKGWRILSITPVTKGVYGREKETFSGMSVGAYGLGYGFPIVEGLLIVWEKSE